MNEFAQNFNNNEQQLKMFVEQLQDYNNILESIYVKMIEEIKSNFLGKKITKAFGNKIETLFNGVCLVSVRKGIYHDEQKEISIVLSDYRYEYNLRNSATSMITCKYGENCTELGEFNEDTIQEIVNIINTNRYRVARYKDALKNYKKHKKILEKAAEDFIAKMESINPIFVDYTAISNLYGVSPKIHFDFNKYESAIKAGLETFALSE